MQYQQPNDAAMKMNTLKIYLLSIVLLLGACKSSYQPLSIPITKDVKTSKAMVITAHPFASQVGLDVLKKGGNAVDAAIAVQFALAVCYPAAGNIGGGGFMVYRDKNGNVKCLDFREKAPMAATTNMYLDADGNVIADLSTTGHLAVGVPGVVDGMWQAFEQYSKLKDWKSLVQPAIDGASYGVILTEREAKGLNAEAKTFDLVNKRKTAFTTNPNWKVGDLFIQKELAGTLKSIRDKGRAGFYEGKVAKTLVKEMQKGNGLITLNDLMDYKAVWRTPITFTYKGYEIVSMPPPSSGGIALMQLMKMIEPYDIQSMGLHSTNSTHLIVEAERRVYADRAAHLGDSDFYPVPIKTMTSSVYLKNRMSDFNPSMATKSEQIKAGQIKESDQTTHFSIVDEEGNAVSITTTLNDGYGCKVIVEGGGYLLNNEMDDFSAKPGEPNLYGLIGAEANKVEPGKRMLSSMTPTIVSKNGKLKAVVGTPGGSTIITSVFQTLINIIDFDMNGFEAVAKPRFHHQWLPDLLYHERNCLDGQVKIALTERGHILSERGAIGRVEAIVYMPDGTISGGADPRGDDDAKGY